MIDRLDERQRIARTLREVCAKQRVVNDIPAVQKARAARQEAKLKLDAADAAFREVFDAHYPHEDAIVAGLLKEYPDLLIDSYDQPVLCAATGLAVFKGDKVIATPDDEDDPDNAKVRTAVLLDVVAIKQLPSPRTE